MIEGLSYQYLHPTRQDCFALVAENILAKPGRPLLVRLRASLLNDSFGTEYWIEDG